MKAGGVWSEIQWLYIALVLIQLTWSLERKTQTEQFEEETLCTLVFLV